MSKKGTDGATLHDVVPKVPPNTCDTRVSRRLPRNEGAPEKAR